MRHSRALLGVVLVGLLVAWFAAGAFFAIIALSVARMRGPTAPIEGLHAAAVTAVYSLGGALLLLGATWLALADARRAIGRAALVWLGATALLLATRQVSGWPLLVATVVALVIAIDIIRRLGARLLGIGHS